MAEDLKALEEWKRAHPHVMQPGPLNKQMQVADRMALLKGYNRGDQNYLAYLDREVEGTSDDGVVMLTEEQKKTAREIGSDPDAYANGVARLEYEKRMGWRQ